MSTVVSRLSLLSGHQSLSEEDRKEYMKLQNELDNIYRIKAEGASIRSRVKWMEEGEQNLAYFFRLEKRKSRLSSISQLDINGEITNDAKKISMFCTDFYSNLYSSRYSEETVKDFLKSIKNCKKISDSDRQSCDYDSSTNEIKRCIKKFKNNKSPGNDGLIAEFYKSFIEEITPFLLCVYQESICNELLPPTMTQGIITLIPKPNKNLDSLDNWHPITLLNNDYKILASIFANRLKNVLDTIIDETQSGFMRNWHITNNIRLVLDLLDYNELIHDGSLIMFLDFYKAFDSVEHPFIFKALQMFGFGEYFSCAIKTLYKNGNSCIKLKHGTSRRFCLSRGIRQGCPVSPYLFLMASQLLATYSIYIKAVCRE